MIQSFWVFEIDMRSDDYKTIDFEVRNESISFLFCHCRIQIARYTSRSEGRVFGLYSRGWFIPPLFLERWTRSTNEIEAIEIEDRKRLWPDYSKGDDEAVGEFQVYVRRSLGDCTMQCSRGSLYLLSLNNEKKLQILTMILGEKNLNAKLLFRALESQWAFRSKLMHFEWWRKRSRSTA